jgi:hypothetical protein
MESEDLESGAREGIRCSESFGASHFALCLAAEVIIYPYAEVLEGFHELDPDIPLQVDVLKFDRRLFFGCAR